MTHKTTVLILQLFDIIEWNLDSFWSGLGWVSGWWSWRKSKVHICWMSPLTPPHSPPSPHLLPQLDAQNIMFSSQTVFCWMAERLVKCIASQIMLHIPPIWRNPAHKSHINFPRKRKSGSAEKLISSLERQSTEGEWKTRANELRRGLGCCTFWVTPLFSPTFLSWQHKRISIFWTKLLLTLTSAI